MLQQEKYVGLDFETFSEVDLRKHSLDRYASHPSFTPLIGCVSISDATQAEVFDFVFETDDTVRLIERLYTLTEIENAIIVAHNAGFERRVLRHLGVRDNEWLANIRDSAVIARAQGAASHLEAAAPQLTRISKLDTGSDLIKLFSIPNEWNKRVAPTPDLFGTEEYLKWKEFIHYCIIDATASRYIAEAYPESISHSSNIEAAFEKMTASMNEIGWKVDLDLVREMKLRYEQNVDEIVAEFESEVDAKLNLNSPRQLKAWCADRGIRATGFDADKVKALYKVISDKLSGMSTSDPKYIPYWEVRFMLEAKMELGGSSLKKLEVILDTVGEDGRLRNQYVHVGAGQTYRTSARGVQMQNLKRLSDTEEMLDMETLYDQDQSFSNDLLAENLRQVFTASDPSGFLIVGDFSSVESRGLAYLAGAEWKLDAFRAGKDIYKVLAERFYNASYDTVTKEQRNQGKYSELSCGYQAGPGAVKNFLFKWGADMTEDEALELVRAWRDSNPEVVELWAKVDETLNKALSNAGSKGYSWIALANNLILTFRRIPTPPSLSKQHLGAQSLSMELRHKVSGRLILERVFHGVYRRGTNVCYFKPSPRKTGDLWTDHHWDAKLKKTVYYTIYGGKLSGILTQSLCRELFFDSLLNMHKLFEKERADNAKIVGQFHDEIVVDWIPGRVRLDKIEAMMEYAMPYRTSEFSAFPLVADIKRGYRYIK